MHLHRQWGSAGGQTWRTLTADGYSIAYHIVLVPAASRPVHLPSLTVSTKPAASCSPRHCHMCC